MKHAPGSNENCACRVEGSSFIFCPLHAAAPKLFEALKALYENCAMVHKRWGINCNQHEADAAIAAGLAAIQEVEGGTI